MVDDQVYEVDFKDSDNAVITDMYAVFVRNDADSSAGSTSCTGAAALSVADANSGSVDHGGLITETADGRHVATIRLQGDTDGRTEETVNDGVHDDLSGTAHDSSTYALCVADKDDRDADGDFTLYSTVHIHVQHSPPSAKL